ncbi:hypothetical protein ACFWPX_08130 [Nocardia sp. NPDC058518]|uniref:DUF7064 domain-containing protein n=1 Tax=Nocardia sp. NPDC058518 TaxID=3346534 RepID=UPI00365F4FBA
MITPLDEELHEPGSGPHWQESYYFNWSTDDGRSFGFTRIGIDHHAGTADAVLVMLRDGEPELVYAAVGERIPPGLLGTSMAEGLAVADLRYVMIAPLGSWRIELRGRHHVDLLWETFTPAVDFHEGFPGAMSDVQHHFEQSGRVTGKVAVHGRAAEVSGLGQRDKSWGVRDWNGIRGWDWIVGQFGDDLSFNATLTDIDGVRTPVGYVFDSTAADPVGAVRAVDIAYTGDDPHRPQTARIEIRTENGVYVVTGRAAGRVPLFKRGLFIEETQFAFECETGGRIRQGQGVVEHAFHVGVAGVAQRLPRLARVALRARQDSRR